jgi:thioredoxin 2
MALAQAEDMLLVACAACLTGNRVPRERLDEAPKCGQCGAPLLEGKPVPLDESRFDGFVARTELPLLVDFWAPWCAPCRMMAPAFERAAAEFATRVRFAKVNTDAAPALAARFGIRSIPTLVLLRDGREVDRVSGALDARRLRQWLGAQRP